jgi:hypothetical protein
VARKRQSAGAKKAAAARAVERSKAKFWVPPSLATDGGNSKPQPVSKKKAAPKPKFWTPAQLGLVEKANFEKWQGGGGVRHEVEHLGTVRLAWYWHGDSAPTGLAVEGLPGHERHISAYLAMDWPKYSDPLLSEIDARPKDGAAGWCHACESASCDGVRWAISKLQKRNPIPF